MHKLWNNTRYHVGLALLRLAVFIIPSEVMQTVEAILCGERVPSRHSGARTDAPILLWRRAVWSWWTGLHPAHRCTCNACTKQREDYTARLLLLWVLGIGPVALALIIGFRLYG